MANNMRGRLRKIKDHFEREAAVFDRMFFKVMPRYREMIEAVIGAFPFKKGYRPKVIDLGCGTGNLAEKITGVYPGAEVTCLDMAENMLNAARAKLKGRKNVKFWLGYPQF
jgi:tRNA (cmo5U34)-methyltransferase